MKINFIKPIFFLLFSLLFGFSYLSYKSGECKNQAIDQQNKYLCEKIKFLSKTNYFLDKGVYTINLLSKNYGKLGYFSLTNRVINNSEDTKKRFSKLKPRFNFNYDKGTRENAGYLLISFADPNKDGNPSVELWDLNKQTLIHSYAFNNDELREYMGINLSIGHPLLLDDGSLIFNTTKGTLVKTDICGRIINSNGKEFFHHSIEMDDFGKIYIPTSVRFHKSEKLREDFIEDKITIIDKDLNILKNLSLIDVYKENGFINDIFSSEFIPKDPFHINDIQPFVNSKNELIALISLRNKSTLMAIDIEKNKIIWKIERISSGQHDIDIINTKDDHIDISIFDNNTFMYKEINSKGNRFLTFSNLPTIFNNQPKVISSKKDLIEYEYNVDDFSWLSEHYRPKTTYQGQFEYINNNNSLMVEETDFGRIFEIDLKNKKILWQFINKKNKDSVNFFTSWSRRMEKLPSNLRKNDFKNCLNNQ